MDHQEYMKARALEVFKDRESVKLPSLWSRGKARGLIKAAKDERDKPADMGSGGSE